MKKNQLTTSSGMPVSDDENSQTIGRNGPIAIQDHHLVEKLAHFNRERIPERVVHARGSGAYGTFKLSKSLKDFTVASFLQNEGEETELFLRFSTVGGEQGSSDMVRDPRGFAVKFYTKEGNYDVVGNNTPVFFIRDPIKFPDFVHTQKRCPVRGINDPDAVWDFWSQNPQSLHQVIILMSDRGIPLNFRHMNGYGSHTYAMWNKNGERFWIKWHFKTNQGIKTLTNDEASKIAGTNPQAAQADLFDNIEEGKFPSWTVKIQIMPFQDAEKYPGTFDVTKVWAHQDYPMTEIGQLELNKNPDNYFSEVEQSAFSPSNFIPGIGPSPDRMLQARIFAYPDAHRYRLGANYNSLDVNSPRGIEVSNYQRDGQMAPRVERTRKNYGTYDNSPLSNDKTPSSNAIYAEPSLKVQEGSIGRFDHRRDIDDFIQAGNLYRIMTQDQKRQLIDNISDSLGSANKVIQDKMLILFIKVSDDLGNKVRKALNL
ncbi:catalase [Bacteriovoracaceae bacterium]|nr:catalase [Bacteriovoracaceae bacterium]